MDEDTTRAEAEEAGRGAIGATLGLFDGDRGPSRGDRMTDGGPGAPRPTVGSGFEPGGVPAAGRVTGGSDERPDGSDGTEAVDRLEDRIDGLRADLDAVEAELSDIRAERERNAEAIERLDRRLEAVETLPEEFATVFEDLESD